MNKLSKCMISVLLSMIVIVCGAMSVFAVDLSDGTYKVNVYLWHSEDDKESMAAAALEETAYIVAENGTYTMHISTGEMTMMFITASLQELYISDGNGNYVDAVVESTDNSGNPTGFYFVLPHTDEYVDVKVNPHIAMMGNRDIGARIKIDYSSIEKTEAYTVSVPETTTQTTAQTTTQLTTETTTAETTTVAETTTSETTTQEIITEAETQVNEIVTNNVVSEDETSSEEKESGGSVIKIVIVAVVVLAVIAGVVVLIIKKRA